MHVISLVIAIVAIGVFVFIKHLIKDKEIEISFIAAQEHTSKDLEYSGMGINYYEWIIISNEVQMRNLGKMGYVIPRIDFEKNYIIMSRYKISKLYRKASCNKCIGVPDGRAIFDKGNSNSNFYYFYLMPKIMLSQGVG